MSLSRSCFVALMTICFFLLMKANVAAKREVYIVYMGASTDTNAKLLQTLTERNKGSVLQTYTEAFSGFAARLTEEEAKSIAETRGVVSVFREPTYKLLTTRSWDFLESQNIKSVVPDVSSSASSSSSSGADTIIGVIDSGIWPESASFDDTGMGPVPAQWKGKCMEASDFKSSLCNREEWPELIGVDAAKAESVIKSENPYVKVIVIPKGSGATCEYNSNRVRLWVDEHHRVAKEPKIG